MGKVRASCCHWLTEEEGIGEPIEYADWIFDRSYPDGGFYEGIVYAVMCKECLKKKWLKQAIKRAKELKKEWGEK